MLYGCFQFPSFGVWRKSKQNDVLDGMHTGHLLLTFNDKLESYTVQDLFHTTNDMFLYNSLDDRELASWSPVDLELSVAPNLLQPWGTWDQLSPNVEGETLPAKMTSNKFYIKNGHVEIFQLETTEFSWNLVWILVENHQLLEMVFILCPVPFIDDKTHGSNVHPAFFPKELHSKNV